MASFGIISSEKNVQANTENKNIQNKKSKRAITTESLIFALLAMTPIFLAYEHTVTIPHDDVQQEKEEGG